MTLRHPVRTECILHDYISTEVIIVGFPDEDHYLTFSSFLLSHASHVHESCSLIDVAFDTSRAIV